jgi:hypothetical protein
MKKIGNSQDDQYPKENHEEPAEPETCSPPVIPVHRTSSYTLNLTTSNLAKGFHLLKKFLSIPDEGHR